MKGVAKCLCYTHLRRAFVDALSKDIHDPEASKPAQAVLRLNQLFEIEKELEGLPPEQKKKERINILSDMPGSTFLENPEYLDDYLPWDPMVQERCR